MAQNNIKINLWNYSHFKAHPLVSIESIVLFYIVKYGLPADGHVFLLRILQLKNKLKLHTATPLLHFNQWYLELKKI